MKDSHLNPVDYPVPEAIVQRWSPVSYDATPIEPARLAACFESARWAASCFNEQPWRFMVARREDEPRFAAMFACLVEGNQEWVRYAGALVIVCTMNSFQLNGKPNAHAWFDAGQATAYLMLGANHQGLHCRAMAGFRPDQARETLRIPAEATPICAVAIGHLDDGHRLAPATAERDQAPRLRNPLDGIVFEGEFGQTAGFVRG